MKMLQLLAALMLTHFTGAFNFHNQYVINLTWTDFNSSVLESNSVWIVKFYTSWCNYSIKAAPEYSKAAEALSGVIKLGAVDVEVRHDLSKMYDIHKIPDFKIFGKDKANPKNFTKKRTAAGFVKAGLDAVNEKVMAVLGNSE